MLQQSGFSLIYWHCSNQLSRGLCAWNTLPILQYNLYHHKIWLILSLIIEGNNRANFKELWGQTNVYSRIDLEFRSFWKNCLRIPRHETKHWTICNQELRTAHALWDWVAPKKKACSTLLVNQAGSELNFLSNVANRLFFSARGCTVSAGCSSLLPALQVSVTISRLSSWSVKGELGCVHVTVRVGGTLGAFLHSSESNFLRYNRRPLYAAAPYQVHKRYGNRGPRPTPFWGSYWDMKRMVSAV